MSLELFVSLAGLLISTFAILFTIFSFKKQLQLQFFADYTKRYQEIILNFPENINESTFDLNSLDKCERDKTLRYMRAYFDLCAEEYFLWRKNNIDKETWSEWETGIKFALSKTSFKQAWEILRLDSIYYGEFVKFVTDQNK